MKIQIYSIKDRATDSYNTPQFLHSNQQAVRIFADQINNHKDVQENFLAKYPDDYTLHHLGEFDTNSGKFTNAAEIEQIAIGKDLVTKA